MSALVATVLGCLVGYSAAATFGWLALLFAVPAGVLIGIGAAEANLWLRTRR